ncbi:signal peptidase I [Pseudonocardia hispaniensis]|uniref:Signal peptidase I n=1 Tax=Pseudonocardia hispaniensis TaxID=904933 RepID=A0ABW1J369_9PSEU
MALPELPDDRRAPPRRYSPADPVGPPGSVPQDRRATQPIAGWPEPPAAGPRNGRPAHVPGQPGSSTGGAPPRPTNGHRAPDGHPGPARNGHPVPPPPRDDAPRYRGNEIPSPRDAGQPTQPVSRQPAVPPELTEEPDADDPAAPPRASAERTSSPGRHRRRAGESPSGRPVSSYGQEPASASARRRPPRGGRRRRASFWKELPLLVAVALLLTFLIQTFVAKVYVIPSGSMETTLHGCAGCNNDRVIVDKVVYRFSDPQPGDVVVFRGPDSWRSEAPVAQPASPLTRGLQQLGSLIGLAPPDEKDFVKRVIAVGGQTVSCCDSRNRVLVDGQPLTEPYLYYLPEAGPARQIPFGPIQVPAGELWMMGDSRNNSADSRVPGHGPVPIENVIGKARMVVLPFDRFGGISSTDPQAQPAGMSDTGIGGSSAPLALGLLGTLPLAIGRRWRRSWEDGDAPVSEFRPTLREPAPRWLRRGPDGEGPDARLGGRR